MNYTEKDLTDWFSSRIKPVRKGVYMTNFGYALWTGARWGTGRLSIRAAIEQPEFIHAVQNKRWRGLNYDPATR